jgi:hypothetical protein
MSSKNKSVPSAGEKQFYVQSVAPEELSDYMFVLSMILGAAAMFVKVPRDRSDLLLLILLS